MPVANLPNRQASWVDCRDLPTGRQARVGSPAGPHPKPAPVLGMCECPALSQCPGFGVSRRRDLAETLYFWDYG